MSRLEFFRGGIIEGLVGGITNFPKLFQFIRRGNHENFYCLLSQIIPVQRRYLQPRAFFSNSIEMYDTVRSHQKQKKLPGECKNPTRKELD